MAQTALLLMDLQNAIIDRVGDLLDPGFTARIQKVTNKARQMGMPIIYVVVRFREGFPEVSASNKLFSGAKAAKMPFTEVDAATEVHANFAPLKGDIIVTKRRVGAFAGSDLEVVLRSQGIDHLVLTGLATSGVVLSTLRLAADLDYKLTVISDCCGDRDAEVHKVLTEKVFPMQADVVNAEQWIDSL